MRRFTRPVPGAGTGQTRTPHQMGTLWIHHNRNTLRLCGYHPAGDRASCSLAYEGKDGPNKWATLDPAYSECKVGHHQSPIDIRHTEKAGLPPIQFDYSPTPLKIVDNGHTVMVNYAPGSFITVGDHRYQLTQFHFHHPSEEHIHGKGFDMVIHMVHSDASGNLAVVAVLLKSGKVNSALQIMWDHLPKEKNK